MGNICNDVHKHNKDILIGLIDIHSEDLVAIDNSIDMLINARLGVFKEIRFEDNNAYNWVIYITNEEGQTFYLELSEHGNVAVVKKDNVNGEIIIDYLSDDNEQIIN